MITISQATEQVIFDEPFIEELLGEGLINISALARKILPDIEAILNKKVNPTAISMALKRYSPNENLILFKNKNKISGFMDEIIVRSNLIDFTFENSPTMISCHEAFISKVIENKNIFYTYSNGVSETTIIVSSIAKDNIQDIFKNEVLINKKDSLSSITIKLRKENVMQVGLYYFILKNLSWRGVNIIEVISTMHEFTIVIKDKDINQTFLAIKNMGE